LKSLHIRSKGINIIACPSCSRQEFDVIKTVNALEQRLEDITEYMDVAVIGCVVNGPGEAKAADIGLTGGSPCLIFLEGKPSYKVSEEQIVDELEKQVRARIEQRKLAPQETSKSIPIKVAG